MLTSKKLGIGAEPEQAPIAFIVPGKPITKARPRLGKGGVIYTPHRTKEYEGRIRAAAIDAKRTAGMKDDDVIEGPVEVRLIFGLNGGEPYTHVQVIPLEGAAKVPKDRPDLDNLVKAALDGLQSAQRGVESAVPIMLRDDRQVVRLVAEFDI